MMALPVTLLYVSLSALMIITLSVLVIKARIRHQVAIGDGGADLLGRYIRAHANFVEYVPFILLLIAALESVNISIYLLHAFGILMLIGRISHAYSLISHEPASIARGRMDLRFRQLGMMLTFGILGIAAIIGLISVMQIMR